MTLDRRLAENPRMRLSVRLRIFRIVLLVLSILRSYLGHRLLSLFLSRDRERSRLSRLHKRNAARLRDTAVFLRGILIKLGQFLSARVDLLPEEFTSELALLQDAVPPAPYEQIRARLIEELKRPPEELFAKFNEIPIAAASLGQVHEAHLADGRRVAVKVQYPWVAEVVRADLTAIRLTAKMLQYLFPTIRCDLLYTEFARALSEELNYIHEGHNAETFYKNFRDDPRIVVPAVYWEWTTRTVLTLEFVEGIKIIDLPSLCTAGVKSAEVVRLLVESYMVQILKHRFFHADPHPGNLFVQPPAGGAPLRLVYVDFGLMQKIGPALYGGVRGLMEGIIDRDYDVITERLSEIGFIARTGDRREIERVVTFFMERYRDMTPREFKTVTFGRIREDLEAILRASPSLQIPNHVIVFGRTAGMLNGLCSLLYPESNIIELAEPHVKRFISGESLIEKAIKYAERYGRILLDLPERTHRFLSMATRGEFQTLMTSPDISGTLTRIYKLLYRSILFLSALISSAAAAYLHDSGRAFLAGGFGFLSAILLLMVLGSLIRDFGWSGRR